MTEPSDEPVATFTEPEHKPDFDEATSEDQAVANVMPIRSRLGLLDLPPDLRVMIFRHLLLYPFHESVGRRSRLSDVGSVGWGSESKPSVDRLNILRTSRLMYREASGVLYRENQYNFTKCFGLYSGCSLAHFPRVRDTIRNIQLDIHPWPMRVRIMEIGQFLRLIDLFGNPSILRGTLTVCFVSIDLSFRRLKWFIRALGRFTNFQTVELYLECWNNITRRGFRDELCHLVGHLKSALEPVLGYANFGSHGQHSLRFHPVHRRNRLEEHDWSDFLDGIRLELGEENVTNARDSETPVPN